jgi:hypothetical protein
VTIILSREDNRDFMRDKLQTGNGLTHLLELFITIYGQFK